MHWVSAVGLQTLRPNVAVNFSAAPAGRSMTITRSRTLDAAVAASTLPSLMLARIHQALTDVLESPNAAARAEAMTRLLIGLYILMALLDQSARHEAASRQALNALGTGPREMISILSLDASTELVAHEEHTWATLADLPGTSFSLDPAQHLDLAGRYIQVLA